MLEPIKFKVLILPDGKKTETESGLYTGVFSVEGATRRGTVVAVGNSVKEVKPNDRVIWDVSIENFVEHEGVRYVNILESQIFGKIDDK